MAKFGQTNIMVGGGGSSDECTAKLSDIPEGLTAITSDSNDEPGRGTMRLTGTVAPWQVLEGQTYYSDDYKTKQTGTMPNGCVPDPKIGGINENFPNVGIRRGTSAQFSMTTVSKEKLFAICPETEGFFDMGVGYLGIPANELGLANANQVLQGCTFTSAEGINIAGQMTVNSILSFSVAAYSGRRILANWTNPNQAAGRPYSGVIIRYSTGGYPGASGGTIIYKGAGNNHAPGANSQTFLDLPNLGTRYFFSCIPYVTTSIGEMLGSVFNAEATTSNTRTEIITSYRDLVVPDGYTFADICTVGGGCGGSSVNGRYSGNSGGCSGNVTWSFNHSVSPGQILKCFVGAGGFGHPGGSSSSNVYGNPGGRSYVIRDNVELQSANGGAYNSGGSGCGAYQHPGRTYHYSPWGNGGIDGQNGYKGATLISNGIGVGQGWTTRAFGNGTRYAGGGGASGYTIEKSSSGEGTYYIGNDAGIGQDGAGSGGMTHEPGYPASANTGSGGGAAGVSHFNTVGYFKAGGNGGSGIIIILFH